MPCHWTPRPRALSRGRVASVCAPPSAGMAAPAPANAVRSRSSDCSVIAHAWVEDTVQDVRDQIEDDDRDRGDHQPRHDRVHVLAEEVLDEVVAHPVELEDLLGDDGTADERAEV